MGLLNNNLYWWSVKKQNNTYSVAPEYNGIFYLAWQTVFRLELEWEVRINHQKNNSKSKPNKHKMLHSLRKLSESW